MTFRYVSLEEAKAAVIHWDGDPQSVVHIENSSSSVFKFETHSSGKRILRFIDNNQRSFDEVQGEVEFLQHLKGKGVRSCTPELSNDGLLARLFPAKSGLQTCSAMKFIPGIEVDEVSQYWNKDLFRKWGQNLASLHRASRSFSPQKIRRWRWGDEHLIRNADKLIPPDDIKSKEFLREIIAQCAALERTKETFGLIHGDHAPNNFIFDPETEEITAIDFGNCCYHWYLADLGIAFSVVRRKNNREEIKAQIMEGYCETERLPKDYEDLLNLFIRLRVIYVYLNRLHRFGPNPVEKEAELINTLRERVHADVGW